MRILLILSFICISINAYALTASYNVSNTAINSLICPDNMAVTDIFISEKSPVRVDTRKDRVFVEFLATVLEYEGFSSMEYATEPATMVLFCDDDEYTVTMRPRNIAGISVELPVPEGKKIKVELEGLRREEQLTKLIQMILTDSTSGFKSVSGDQAIHINDKEVYLRKIHTAGAYQLKEVYVYADSISAVTEEELLSIPFISYPIALTIPEGPFTGWIRVIAIEEVR